MRIYGIMRRVCARAHTFNQQLARIHSALAHDTQRTHLALLAEYFVYLRWAHRTHYTLQTTDYTLRAANMVRRDRARDSFEN